MAGLFLFLCFWHFLGGYFGYFGYLDSILGVNLEFLCFHLSSIWDSILDLLVSILEFLPAGSGKVFLSTPDTQIVQT